MSLLVHTCKGMDGEGLMGLNNVHLKLKVNGAAASQRNSMANTRDRRGKKRDESIFFMIRHQRVNGSMAGCMEEYKETGKPSGR